MHTTYLSTTCRVGTVRRIGGDPLPEGGRQVILLTAGMACMAHAIFTNYRLYTGPSARVYCIAAFSVWVHLEIHQRLIALYIQR